ncbi:hypothetical protein RHSIM_Rhsim13G0228000 [Rhododendron simsii]|uniref:Uncharacterized protein n=1 Tax=Rhododendron simsii TaxID=118357 RepID=A0A834G1A8_RHOSS|nr:hypothetical protein RHSIM_Rhsim13G0228000 [Rhododendron simsii]
MEMSLEDMLVKVGMFVLVQALVYLILSNSSNIFSSDSKLRSLSFKPARSVSIRRMLAAISDVPQGGEASPVAASRSSTQSDYSDHEY